MKKKKRTSIPQRTRLMAELLQEVGSRCPFCSSQEVGFFHIHHIDENPSNNDKGNLLAVCPTCHSKIDKRIIPMESVRAVKISTLNRHVNIEFVSAVVVEEYCRWQQKKENCFYSSDTESDIPVISFTLINHFASTVVLKCIRMFVKRLPSGLNGVPQACVLKSSASYRLCIKKYGENIYPLSSPLQIPAGVAAKFNVEVYSKMVGDIDIAPTGRYVLNFFFDFNAGITLAVPPVLLNCMEENEPLQILHLC